MREAVLNRDVRLRADEKQRAETSKSPISRDLFTIPKVSRNCREEKILLN